MSRKTAPHRAKAALNHPKPSRFRRFRRIHHFSLSFDEQPVDRQKSELEEFAYIVGHDLQAPIRAISGFSQLLREDLGAAITPEADGNLRQLEAASTRLKMLIQGVLAYSRSSTNNVHCEWLSLSACASEALEQLARKIDGLGASIQIDPMPEVFADPRLICNVYANLIDNALIYQEPGKRPSIRLTAEGRDGRWIFGVQDNGIGVAERNRERIFSPLKRLHPPNRYPGAGIGLTICRKLIERHGGRIWIEEAPDGIGTHVRFILGSTGCMSQPVESSGHYAHDGVA